MSKSCPPIAGDDMVSGGSRNSERGVQPLAHKVHPKIFGLPHPLPVT